MKLMDRYDQIHFDWRKKVGRYLAEKVEHKGACPVSVRLSIVICTNAGYVSISFPPRKS